MFKKNSLRRLGVAFSISLALAGGAAAQVDPPGRVARIGQFEGNVSFAPAGTDDWAYAQRNRPMTVGDRLWVESGSRAELHLGSTALRLDGPASLEFLELDDDTGRIKLTRGSASLRLRELPSGEHYEIDTPNLAFVPNAPGEYRLDVDGGMTNVLVRDGGGTAYGEDGVPLALRAGRQTRFSGTRLAAVGTSETPPRDAFDAWVRARDRAEEASVSARYVSRDMIGYQQLDDHGTWRETSEYGPIWVPRVTVAGWAPYRTGHWAWIRPWGWTWIDDSPWGFAPYHYGRWVYWRNHWSWVPGRVAHRVRPVYAPALVAFVGGGNRVDVTISIGGRPSSGVAWFPLGPGEAYRPAYRASPRYINNVNQTVIVNKTVINQTTINQTTVNKTVYVNQRAPNAVTAVPRNAFVRGEPVARVAHVLPRQQLAATRVLAGAPDAAPIKESVLAGARSAARPALASPPAVAAVRPMPGRNMPVATPPVAGAATVPPTLPRRDVAEDRHGRQRDGAAGNGPGRRGPGTPETERAPAAPAAAALPAPTAAPRLPVPTVPPEARRSAPAPQPVEIASPAKDVPPRPQGVGRPMREASPSPQEAGRPARGMPPQAPEARRPDTTPAFRPVAPAAAPAAMPKAPPAVDEAPPRRERDGRREGEPRVFRDVRGEATPAQAAPRPALQPSVRSEEPSRAAPVRGRMAPPEAERERDRPRQPERPAVVQRLDSAPPVAAHRVAPARPVPPEAAARPPVVQRAAVPTPPENKADRKPEQRREVEKARMQPPGQPPRGDVAPAPGRPGEAGR